MIQFQSAGSPPRIFDFPVSPAAVALLPGQIQKNILDYNFTGHSRHFIVLDSLSLRFLDVKRAQVVEFSHMLSLTSAASGGNRWIAHTVDNGGTLVVLFQPSLKEAYYLDLNGQVHTIQPNGRWGALGQVTSAAFVNKSHQLKINGLLYDMTPMSETRLNRHDFKLRSSSADADSIEADGDEWVEHRHRSGHETSNILDSQELQLARLNSQQIQDESTGAAMPLDEYLRKTFRVAKRIDHSSPIESHFSLDYKNEFESVMVGLRMSRSGGVLVLGPSGVGKSYFLENAIAEVIRKGELDQKKVPLFLHIAATDFASNGTMGKFESKMNALKLAAQKVPLVLVADEITTLIGQGAHRDNPNDFFDMIKSELAQGSIRMVGATTEYEYELLARSLALERRFPIRVRIEEPSLQRTVPRVHGFIKRHWPQYSTLWDENRLLEIIKWIEWNQSVGANPDKSISFIDSYFAWCDVSGMPIADCSRQDFIDEWGVRYFGFDVKKFSRSSLRNKMSSFSNSMKAELIGLDAQIDAVEAGVISYFTELLKGQTKEPLSFLLLGDAGVGKTTFAQQVAIALDVPFDRIMVSQFGSEFSLAELKSTIARLIRKNPSRVILLDEVEKSSERVQTQLLDLFDQPFFETIVETGEPKKVDLRKTIFIMSSNAGADAISEGAALSKIRQEAERVLIRPLMDRPSQTLVFKTPTQEHMNRVILFKWGQLRKRKWSDYKIVVNEDLLIQWVKSDLQQNSVHSGQMGFAQNGEGAGLRYSIRDLDRTLSSLERQITKMLFDEQKEEHKDEERSPGSIKRNFSVFGINFQFEGGLNCDTLLKGA